MNEHVVAPDPAVLAGLDNYLKLPAAQQPSWPDAAAVADVRAELATLPPLVFAA